MRSNAALLSALALALSLGLASCGGEDTAEPDASSSPSESPSASATPAPPVLSPLTGLVLKNVPKRPVMVVKIDNTSSSRPQVGLRRADLITEELVEGGITRLAVFYYSQLADTVGPVRSMRTSDIGIVKPLNATLVASGAAPPTLARLRGAKVRFVDGGAGYFREGSRRSPYNLLARLPEVAKAQPATATPKAYLPWGTTEDFTSTTAANGLSASFSRRHSTDWKFAGGTYTNLNTHAGAGRDFKPQTVLVLRVRQGDAGYRDPAGNPVPETIFEGTGNMAMFHDGRLVRGTWSKANDGAPVALQAGGAPVKVPAGKVWIELVPTDADGGRLTVR